MRYSIIIPYGNAGETVGPCLDSVIVAADRFGRPCEIICVNGGSTDQTRSLIDDYARRDARIVHHGCWTTSDGRKDTGNWIGPGRARTFGLDQARGDYVVFVDADDTVEPDALVRLAAYEADIVTFLPPEGHWDMSCPGERIRMFSALVGNLLVWNAMYRREAIGEWRFPSLRNCEDLVWTAGAFARAKTVIAGIVPWYHHEEHRPESLANTVTWRRVRDSWQSIGLIRAACRGAHVGLKTHLILVRKLALHFFLHVVAILPRVRSEG